MADEPEIIPPQNQPSVKDTALLAIQAILGITPPLYGAYHPELPVFIQSMLGIYGTGASTVATWFVQNKWKKIESVIGTVKEELGKSDTELTQVIADREGADVVFAQIINESAESESANKNDIFASLFCAYLTNEKISSAIILRLVKTLRELDDIQTNILYDAIIGAVPFKPLNLYQVMTLFNESTSGEYHSYFTEDESNYFIDTFLLPLHKMGIVILCAGDKTKPLQLDINGHQLDNNFRDFVLNCARTDISYDVAHRGAFAEFAPYGKKLRDISKEALLRISNQRSAEPS